MAAEAYTAQKAVGATAVDPPLVGHELCSCVADRLSIATKTGRVTVPPLGSVTVRPGDLDLASLAAAEAAGVLRVNEIRAASRDGLAGGWGSAGGALAGVGGAVAFGAHSTGADWEEFALLGVVLLVVAALLVWQFDQLKFIKDAVRDLPERAREWAIFPFVAATLIVLPGAILYFGSGVPDLWTRAYNGDDHDARVALIGIAVQFCVIVGAAGLPVLLYFIFDRERLMTLREKVTRHIFRLDPAVETRRDIEAKYGEWLDEAFGPRHARARYLPGTRWPILIATTVITLGWTVALLDTKPAATAGTGALTALIEPTPAAPTFAFLGAYFFALNSTLRGFVRGDLRPKTYAQIATRIVGSVVLAFALERFVRGTGADASSASLLTFAFLMGVVPETFLVRLQEAFRNRAGRRQGDPAGRTYETEPLTRLQGIDIYDRARLLDEGVTNVEGLAHHDIVELLLKTRLSATRLIDWVDQAILFIHCAACEEDQASERSGPSVLTQLRRHGIRTATGLCRAYEDAADKREFLKIVARPAGKPPIIPVVIKSIEHEDWMGALTYWRSRAPEPRRVHVPEDFAPV